MLIFVIAIEEKSSHKGGFSYDLMTISHSGLLVWGHPVYSWRNLYVTTGVVRFRIVHRSRKYYGNCLVFFIYHRAHETCIRHLTTLRRSLYLEFYNKSIFVCNFSACWHRRRLVAEPWMSTLVVSKYKNYMYYSVRHYCPGTTGVFVRHSQWRRRCDVLRQSVPHSGSNDWSCASG